MKSPTLPCTAAALALAFAVAPAQARAQTTPRYQAQIQAELQAMGLSPQCAAPNDHVARCTTHAASAPVAPGAPAPARRFVLDVTYDDASDTVYVNVDHYAAVRPDAPNAGEVFRRLLGINWEMLVGKFEWSPESNEVRLSAVLNTDSNFDRRAFRGVVLSLLRLADRYADEVARLTGAPVGQAAVAAPAAPVAPAPAAPAPAAPAPAAGPH